MTPIDLLIRRCQAGEGTAWADLWRVIEDASAGPLARLLAARGGDRSRADDLRQELFLHLWADGATRLGAFHGASLPAFRRYVAIAAVRLARDRLAAERCRREREVIATMVAGSPDRDGPDEAHVHAACSKLADRLSPTERDLLGDFIGRDDGPDRDDVPECPGRTRRRRTEALIRKCRDLLDDM